MDSLGVLRKERHELAARVKALDNAIAALGGIPIRSGARTTGRKMSAATKAKIAAAAKKRWADKKKRKAS